MLVVANHRSLNGHQEMLLAVRHLSAYPAAELKTQTETAGRPSSLVPQAAFAGLGSILLRQSCLTYRVWLAAEEEHHKDCDLDPMYLRGLELVPMVVQHQRTLCLDLDLAALRSQVTRWQH